MNPYAVDYRSTAHSRNAEPAMASRGATGAAGYSYDRSYAHPTFRAPSSVPYQGGGVNHTSSYSYAPITNADHRNGFPGAPPPRAQDRGLHPPPASSSVYPSSQRAYSSQPHSHSPVPTRPKEQQSRGVYLPSSQQTTSTQRYGYNLGAAPSSTYYQPPSLQPAPPHPFTAHVMDTHPVPRQGYPSYPPYTDSHTRR